MKGPKHHYHHHHHHPPPPPPHHHHHPSVPIIIILIIIILTLCPGIRVLGGVPRAVRAVRVGAEERVGGRVRARDAGRTVHEPPLPVVAAGPHGPVGADQEGLCRFQ
jgi:hypothetical protein